MALYFQLGLTAEDLRKLAVSRRNLFMLSVPSVRAKLAFLRTELGMDDADIRRLLLKFPRIIEYRTERTLRPRIDFLLQHGVPRAELSKVKRTFCSGPLLGLMVMATFVRMKRQVSSCEILSSWRYRSTWRTPRATPGQASALTLTLSRHRTSVRYISTVTSLLRRSKRLFVRLCRLC